MNGSIERDPLDELRRADPMSPERVPTASLARVTARVLEDVADATVRERRRWFANLRFVAGGVAVALVLVAVVLWMPRGRSPGIAALPSPSQPIAAAPTATLGLGAATCVELYSLPTLAHRGLAFDGTVTAVIGEEVTFHVNVAYRGVTSQSVTLTATGMTSGAITIGGGPKLSVGDRYLVAGEDHFAWGCGFTQPYDPSLAAAWAATFRK